MVTKEFKIVMDYLGWGDPDATLITVGIEEAETLNEKLIKELTDKVIPVTLEKDPKFSIAYPIAKIACGVSSSFCNWKDEWREYRKNKLWKKGSKICNINVYPLGKKSLKSPLPKNYKKLFGINNWKEYRKFVKERRF